jgi:hypothetical protein
MIFSFGFGLPYDAGDDTLPGTKGKMLHAHHHARGLP